MKIKNLRDYLNNKTDIVGRIKSIRIHKAVAFCILEDETENLQIVFRSPELIEALSKINIESIARIEGQAIEREAKMKNENQSLGDLEFVAEKIDIVSAAEILPFSVTENTQKIDEAKRLEYRYLDLRSQRMFNNLKSRHKMILFLRNYFSDLGFLEIETPILTKGTPEGAREFIIPSRLDKGNFYVLPQSPQQYKQLLMMSDIHRYFQIAKCFRDEDLRGDRQPEFTQFDLEISYMSENEIMKMMERAIVELIEKIFPDKKILKQPFPAMTFKEAMEKYKTDKPDLREEGDKDTLAFCWVKEFPLFEKKDNKISSAHHPFTKPLSSDLDKIVGEPLKASSTAFDLVLNGFEIGSGSLRIYDKKMQKKIFEILGLKAEEIEEKFSHLLRAFSFGVPPHGGLALGLDRLLAIILGEENIREVMAFPKNGEAKDLMTGSPNKISNDLLNELNLKLKESKKENGND